MSNGRTCDGRLVAVAHFKLVDLTLVQEGRVRNGPLVDGSCKRLDPTQVNKGRVRDGRLFAGVHVMRVDPAHLHEGRVRNLIALVHAELLNSAQVNKGRV